MTAKFIIAIIIFAMLECVQLKNFNYATTPLSIINPCRLDLSFQQCVLQETMRLLPALARGKPEYGIHGIDPLYIGNMTTEEGTMKVIHSNAVLLGLSRVNIIEMHVEPIFKGYLSILGNLTFKSNYKLDGKMLMLPLRGEGESTVQMINSSLRLDFRMRKVKRKKEEFLEIFDVKTKQDFEYVKIDLRDSTRQNEMLATSINQLMNDNWREVMNQLGPKATEAITAKLKSLVNKIFSLTPYKKLILQKFF